MTIDETPKTKSDEDRANEAWRCKFKQLEKEIANSGASPRERANMTHTLLKLAQFAAEESDLLRRDKKRLLGKLS
jgi:hypothetical protein